MPSLYWHQLCSFHAPADFIAGFHPFCQVDRKHRLPPAKANENYYLNVSLLSSTHAQACERFHWRKGEREKVTETQRKKERGGEILLLEGALNADAPEVLRVFLGDWEGLSEPPPPSLQVSSGSSWQRENLNCVFIFFSTCLFQAEGTCQGLGLVTFDFWSVTLRRFSIFSILQELSSYVSCLG